jgi:membrane-bound metal-dependent hydrolase YbcI (DUF457 family)
MSWAAHEFESYVIQRHVKARLSYLAVLFGCLLPDLFTKLPVYGLHIGDLELIKAQFPAQYHRGWPGVGPTHSLAFGVVAAVLVLAITKSRGWALGLLIGQWSHVLTDTFDSVGTMLFFPFTTQHYSVDAWAYAAQQGRYGDAAAYYSSLGVVWDVFWLGMALMSFHVFTRRFFAEQVEPADTTWRWLRHRFGFSDGSLVAVYRAWFIYGAVRVVAWSLWARLLNPRRGAETVDFSWGGPAWVEKVTFPAANWRDFFWATAVGITGMALFIIVLWWLVARSLWNRANQPELIPTPTLVHPRDTPQAAPRSSLHRTRGASTHRPTSYRPSRLAAAWRSSGSRRHYRPKERRSLAHDGCGSPAVPPSVITQDGP